MKKKTVCSVKRKWKIGLILFLGKSKDEMIKLKLVGFVFFPF